MLVKPIIILVLTVVLFSCENGNEESQSLGKAIPNEMGEKKSATSSSKAKKIGDFMSDTTDYFWSPKQSDTARYDIRVIFQKEFAVYQFHGQCIYCFFTNHYFTGTDKIELLWSYKTDCVLAMDFLRKSNGVKKYPKAGDAFCEYKLANDSVIEVKYNFPEWTHEINKMEKDSIFPSYFYLQK